MAKVVKGYSKTKRIRSKQKKHRTSFSDVVYRFFAIVLAAALVVAYVSVFIDPTDFHIPMYFGFYFVPLALLNLLMLAAGILHKKRALLIPLIALLPALLISDKYVKIGKDDKTLSGDHIKVMTYNLGRYCAASDKRNQNDAISGVRTFIAAENPDIVCLQEFSADDTEKIKQYLPSYPYVAYYFFKGNRYFGNLTLSRYPIAETEVIKFQKSTNLAIASDIKIGERMVKIYNCHLESYSISLTSFVKRIFNKDEFQEEMALVHERLRAANLKRSEQVRAVLDSEESSCCPTIVCGDFNDTPLSYTYHKLTSSKKDSFVDAGSGFSSTYSGLWPLLTIDYILIPGEYEADNHTVLRVPYSDHYPVTTNIYFTNEQQY